MPNSILDTLQLSVEDKILAEKYGVPSNIFCDGSPESNREKKYWEYVDELRTYLNSGNTPPESLEQLVRTESVWYNTTLVGKKYRV